MYELPEKFEQYSEARRAGFLKVKEIKEKGGRVAGIFCTYTPVEILDAAGIIPVSLCGMSPDPIPAAEAHLPKNLCPLIKSSYGFAVSDACPYTYFSDLIVAETTCDGKKKMYELMDEIRPVYTLKLPQSQDGPALDYWTAEFRRFIAFLEERFGVSVTPQALRAAAVTRNREREAKLRLMEVQKLDPPPMAGYKLYKILEGAGFKFDIEDSVAELNELTDKILEAYEAGERPISPKAKRIMVTGCPIGGVLEKTVKLIEESGAVVVCYENCAGIKANHTQVNPDAPDLIRELADRYLQIGCAVMTPDNNRLALIERLVKEYAIDAVIELDLQACTAYCVESRRIRQHCRALGVPYMAVETDYSQADVGQLATRFEAFVETL